MDRFWNKVDKSGDCWEWTASKLPKGYGQFWYGGQRYGAHRFAYLLKVGHIPEGMCVCHTCDNTSCVNPDHLWLGTVADNLRDMRDKGRGVKPPTFKGEAHVSARLTKDQVKVIKRNIGYVSQKVLAEMFDVHPSAISSIKLGRSWAHVE